MPVYRTRKFGVLAISSCVAAILLLIITTSSIFDLFPVSQSIAYYQLINYDLPTSKPSPLAWSRLNHTVLKLDNATMVSTFTVTMHAIPAYERITVEVGFDDPKTYTEDDPIPEIQAGNQSWSGIKDIDLQVNQTITIYTKLHFAFDSKYSILGRAVNYDPISGSNEGVHTLFYVTVEQGRITNVTDELGQIPPSTTRVTVEPRQ